MGMFSNYLEDTLPSVDIYDLDLLESPYHAARGHKFMQMDIEEGLAQVLVGGDIDFMIATHVFEHVDSEAVASDMFHRLVVGGRLFAILHHPASPYLRDAPTVNDRRPADEEIADRAMALFGLKILTGELPKELLADINEGRFAGEFILAPMKRLGGKYYEDLKVALRLQQQGRKARSLGQEVEPLDRLKQVLQSDLIGRLVWQAKDKVFGDADDATDKKAFVQITDFFDWVVF